MAQRLNDDPACRPATDSGYADAYRTRGVCIVEYALEPDDVAALDTLVSAPGAGHRIPVPELSRSPHLRASLVKLTRLAARLLGASVQPVRAVAFNKTAASNWFVPWHQDRTLSVVKRMDAAGYCNWTEKDGVAHVEPPRAILDGMVTLRVALDACDAEHGPLEVMPGSHHRGVLSRDHIAAITDAETPQVCLTARGDILAMSPLLVHRSQRALAPADRRVLHIEFLSLTLAHALPTGLALT